MSGRIISIWIALCTFMICTDASFNIEILLVRYVNPNSEDCDGGNCESSSFGTCDNLFTFCLRTTTNSLCSYQITSTNPIEDDDFTFTSSILSETGLSNPIIFRSITPSAPLVLEVRVDDNDGFLNADDHVDTIIINFPRTLNLSTTLSPTVSYPGTCRTVNRPMIDVQYRITSNCPENRYGTNCEIICVPQVGQYYCNYLGERVCQGTFTGNDCTQCISDYYGDRCNVFCQPAGLLVCNSLGEHVCINGNFQPPDCTICLPNYYGSACDIECLPQAGQYNCNSDGTRECLGNFAGVNCDTCIPDYYGTDCSTQCIPESSRFRCNSNGVIECNGNYVFPECTQCLPDYYGSTCNTRCVPRDDSSGHFTCNQTDGSQICLRNFAGFDCLDCIENYYGIDCTLFCEPPTSRHVCGDSGPVCRGNYQLPDCTECLPYYFGDTCSFFCLPIEDQYDCTSTPPYRRCLGNFAAPDCTSCIGNFAGRSCTRCTSNYYTSDCSVFCESTSEQVCNSDGVLVDRNVGGTPPPFDIGVGGYIGIAIGVIAVTTILCSLCCCCIGLWGRSEGKLSDLDVCKCTGGIAECVCECCIAMLCCGGC